MSRHRMHETWCFYLCTNVYTKGFDEFMNVVVDEAYEISSKDGTRSEIGRILLKGDNITLISSLDS